MCRALLYVVAHWLVSRREQKVGEAANYCENSLRCCFLFDRYDLPLDVRERHDRDRHERDRRGGGGEKPNLMTALRVLTALETLLGSLAPQVRSLSEVVTHFSES